MSFKRWTIITLIGLSSLSFCYNTSGYTHAMVTSPASMSITCSKEALIGVLDVGIKESIGFFVPIKNNMAGLITIIGIDIRGTDHEDSLSLNVPIASGQTREIVLGQLINGNACEGTMVIKAMWHGGKAEIRQPYRIEVDYTEDQPVKELESLEEELEHKKENSDVKDDYGMKENSEVEEERDIEENPGTEKNHENEESDYEEVTSKKKGELVVEEESKEENSHEQDSDEGAEVEEREIISEQ
jgi:hypothetical protein